MRSSELHCYLPHVEKTLRPSTYKDCKKDVDEKRLKQRLGEIRLRDFRTVTGQRLIREIAEKNGDVGHKTLLHIKSFLSGVFKHARREGFIDTPKSMVDVNAPGRPVKFTGDVYSIGEIDDILQALDVLSPRTKATPIENLVARVIKPRLAKASDEQETLIKWKGWHAFRRGLASNLYSLGIAPKVIQAILRHSDIGTTLSYYVQTPDSETREALRPIEVDESRLRVAEIAQR